MTFAEAAAIMLGSGNTSASSDTPMPKNIQYCDYQTFVQDYEYTGTSYIYGPQRIVPVNSIVISYFIQYDNNSFEYKYNIYELIIEDIDTPHEEVVGIMDHQTSTEYRFQFNTRGGK